MRILITGGTGYLGPNVAEHLARQGHKILLHCHETNECVTEFAENIKADLVLGDIREQSTIKKLTDLDMDLLIHTVSLDHTASEGDISEVNAVNVNPFINMLKNLKTSRIKRVVYFSTAQVYGRDISGAVDENEIPKPVNIYGLTHRFCEEAAEYFSRNSGIGTVSLRLSNVFGAPVINNARLWKLVINDLCKMAFENASITLQSDGSPLRDFVSTEDFCRAVSFAVNSNLEHNVYNVASGNTVTILEVAEEIAKYASARYSKKVSVKLKDGSAPEHKQCRRFAMDNKRMKKLGWMPDEKLYSGLETIFNYLEKHA